MTDRTRNEDVGMAVGTGAGAGGGSGTHPPVLDWPWTQHSTLSEARASVDADLPSNLRAVKSLVSQCTDSWADFLAYYSVHTMWR